MKHTEAHPTDAYGTIEFQGGPHPSKAQVSHMVEFGGGGGQLVVIMSCSCCFFFFFFFWGGGQ